MRDYPEGVLREKIGRKFPDADPEPTIETLKGYGYVDDAAYRRRFIRDRLLRGWGPYAVVRMLYQKKIEASVDDVFAVAEAEEIDIDAILREFGKKYIAKLGTNDMIAVHRKCLAHFYRKGHSRDSIENMLKGVL